MVQLKGGSKVGCTPGKGVGEMIRPKTFGINIATLSRKRVGNVAGKLVRTNTAVGCICSPSTRGMTGCLRSFPSIAITRSLRRVLRSPRVRLITTTTIPGLHDTLKGQIVQTKGSCFASGANFAALRRLRRAGGMITRANGGC